MFAFKLTLCAYILYIFQGQGNCVEILRRGGVPNNFVLALHLLSDILCFSNLHMCILYFISFRPAFVGFISYLFASKCHWIGNAHCFRALLNNTLFLWPVLQRSYFIGQWKIFMVGLVSKRWDQNITKLQKFDLRLESFKVLKKRRSRCSRFKF